MCSLEQHNKSTLRCPYASPLLPFTPFETYQLSVSTMFLHLYLKEGLIYPCKELNPVFSLFFSFSFLLVCLLPLLFIDIHQSSKNSLNMSQARRFFFQFSWIVHFALLNTHMFTSSSYSKENMLFFFGNKPWFVHFSF